MTERVKRVRTLSRRVCLGFVFVVFLRLVVFSSGAGNGVLSSQRVWASRMYQVAGASPRILVSVTRTRYSSCEKDFISFPQNCYAPEGLSVLFYEYKLLLRLPRDK